MVFAKGNDEMIDIDLTVVHPTQTCLGMSEVDRKVEKLRVIVSDPQSLKEYLKEVAPDVVRGPNGVIYVLDRHHEFSALLSLGVTKAVGNVIKDYSDLTMKEFEEKMIEKSFVYLKNENNRKI